MKFIAFCTKGLEKIVEQEISERIPGVNIFAVEDKRVTFEIEIDFDRLTQLKTVDDLCIFVEKFENVSKFEDLLEKVDDLDFNQCVDVLEKYRKVDNTFSLTASFARTPIKPKEVIDSLSNKLSEKYSWKFTELDHSNFDIRVFIDKNVCLVGIRLTQESLQNRKYKTVSLSGSLKPTIAAAMVMIGCGNKNKLKVVDNFCGSGTILCEVKSAGNEVFGGDLNPESVSVTKQNLSYFNKDVEDKIKAQDAIKTNWPDNSFHVAISNLPWDKQIEVDSITDLYVGSLREYRRILKQNGKGVFLVSKPELFIKHAKIIFENNQIKSVPIHFLGQNPTIVIVKI